MSERVRVVMPVYNEEGAIGAVLEKWTAALDGLGVDYEIHPYNDGSRDASLEVMRNAAKRMPRVIVHDKPNSGHGPTILTAYRNAAEAGVEWVFQVDSDDEMGPEGFSQLWARRADFDFLVGRRSGRRQALSRKVVSLVSRLTVLLFYGKSRVWDVNAPYRLMRVAVLAPTFAAIPPETFAPNVIVTGMVAKLGLRALELPVPQHDRMTGEVSIKKWRLLKAAVRSFVQTAMFPLKRRSMGGISL